MSKETADAHGWDGKRYYPYDTDPQRCQCVMEHFDFVEGGLQQCSGARDPRSNRFCTGCEDTHGEAHK